MLEGADVLITGGTGSFGRALVQHLLKTDHGPRRIIVFSRDELKQSEMQRELGYGMNVGAERLRFFLGDVRDQDRLSRAFMGVDYVIHAAALKQVPACEYNPDEAVKTNVLGAVNVVRAAIDSGVKRVIALSTDKACAPLNLYGATKLAAEKIFQAGNNLSGALDTRFSVVRYGNVLGSRGSVVPLFRKQLAEGRPLTITDPRMTRFLITLKQAVAFVLKALDRMEGGEIFVPELPTARMVDLAAAMQCFEQPKIATEVIGIRPGEKLHETLITEEESANAAIRWPGAYVISRGTAAAQGLAYTSDSTAWQLDLRGIRELIDEAGV